MENSKKLRRYAPWLAVAVILIATFIMSAQGGVESNEASGLIATNIMRGLQVLINMAREEPDWKITLELNYFIRKLAHVALYFTLTLFVALGIKGFFKNKAALFSAAALIVLAVAFIDEFHQYFSAGRNSSFEDIIIDLFGAFLAICLMFIYLLIKRMLHWLTEGLDDSE